MPDRVKDKVAIVSGGANGMGAADARLLSREGAAVTIMDLRADLAEPVVTEIRAAGGRVQFVQGDVTSEDDWNRVIGDTVSAFGKLDILVNNAGIGARNFDPDSVADFRRVMDVNMTSVFIGTKLAAHEMRKAGGGSVVNISSIQGVVGDPDNNPVYATSKGAIRIYTKAAANWYARDRIRVNSVHPGYMPRMLQPNDEKVTPSDIAFASSVAWVPMGRIGTVEEVANAVLFLASDEASYTTGAELYVDGGFLAR